MNFDFKNGCKNELRENKKNLGADQEIGFLTKLISKPYGRATAMPPASELINPCALILKDLNHTV